jgi:SPP1 gp7 family putative phage head morphogenesis protein
MKEDLRKTLRAGLNEGEGTEALAKRLSKKFTEFQRSRSRRIAQTESTGAYNGGRVAGMKELGIERKRWINTGDSKVRDSHRITQTVKTDENFTLANGVTIDMPGGNGPASEVVNCRCSVVSVLLDEDEERILEEARRRRQQ